MEFAFSEDQYAFRDAVADLLAGTCPPEAVRAAWDADDPWDRDRWSALAEMGVVGLMAPEAAGGLGMTEVDLVLILEEAGRAALPEPLADTVLLLPLVPDEWQESIASGLIALGVAPADALFIDDKVANANGARAAGLKAHHYQGSSGLRSALQTHRLLEFPA